MYLQPFNPHEVVDVVCDQFEVVYDGSSRDQRGAQRHPSPLPELNGFVQYGLIDWQGYRGLEEQLEVLHLFLAQVMVAKHFNIADRGDHRRVLCIEHFQLSTFEQIADPRMTSMPFHAMIRAVLYRYPNTGTPK